MINLCCITISSPAIPFLDETRLTVVYPLIILAVFFGYYLTGKLDFPGNFNIKLLLIFLPVMFVTGAMGEELGWRGFLLSALRKRWSLLPSALIIGVFWAMYHIPLWLTPNFWYSAIPFFWFVISTLGLSISMAVLVEKGKGSLFLANFTLALIPQLMVPIEPFYIAYSIGNCIFAGIAIFIYNNRK